MQCVEFETRLNEILDKRAAPSGALGLVEHARGCPGCTELLAAHETLLDGVAAMALPRLDEVERLALAHRIVAEVGGAPLTPFPGNHRNAANNHLFAGQQTIPVATPVELESSGPAVVAANRAAPLAIIGLVLATAAALLIALLPWFRGKQGPAAPVRQKQLIVDSSPTDRLPAPGNTTGALRDYDDLALIARVGYQVADGLTPVTSSMVSALRELRKRPLFRNAEDTQGRSSSYLPRDTNQLVA